MASVTSASPTKDGLRLARGRLGYTVADALFYATGGYAAAKVNVGVTVETGGGGIVEDQATQTCSGWTGGGGIEYSFTPSLSAKVEHSLCGAEIIRLRNADP